MQLDKQLQKHIISLPIELKAEVLDFVLFFNTVRHKVCFRLFWLILVQKWSQQLSLKASLPL
jgi:hypothetical protein